MKRAIAMAAALLFVGATTAMAQVASSDHNMVTYIGTGAPTDEVCTYCHAPHTRPTYALWNRTNNAATAYTMYASTTIDMNITEPGEASLACLSCHDGTLPIDAYGGSAGDAANKITGSKNLTQDLSDDHPIGVEYDNTKDPDFNAPGALALARLFGTQVECGSCHNPHDMTFGNFLIASNSGSALCSDCHTK